MGDYLFFMDLTGYYIACNTARQTRICNSNLSINFSVNGRGAKGLKDIEKDMKQKDPFLLGSIVLPFLFHSLLKHG